MDISIDYSFFYKYTNIIVLYVQEQGQLKSLDD